MVRPTAAEPLRSSISKTKPVKVSCDDRGVALLLVCGIPASGKTTFTRWLEREHSWLRVDTDSVYANPRLDPDLHRLLTTVPLDVDGLVEHLGRQSDNVAVEWGFQPLAYMASIELLRAMGVNMWWFDGDRDAARNAYSRREGGAVSAMQAHDVQMARIIRMWPRITAAFDGHVITTVRPGPNHVRPTEVYELIAPSLS